MIQVEPHGTVSIIRLDREPKRNAMKPAMLANLVGALERAVSARAIVLSGAGPVFCAGFDLTLCRDDAGVLGELLTGLSRCVRAVRSAPCPVVVSAHGAAVAGGCALVAAADIVVTNAAAKLGYPVVRLGISPAVNAPTLRVSVGDGAARVRSLDPGLVDGREALRLGLAHEMVERVEECEARAIAVAESLAAKPREGLGYTKRWLGELDGTLDDAVVERALSASMSLVGGDEERARLAELWARADRERP